MQVQERDEVLFIGIIGIIGIIKNLVLYRLYECFFLLPHISNRLLFIIYRVTILFLCPFNIHTYAPYTILSNQHQHTYPPQLCAAIGSSHISGELTHVSSFECESDPSLTCLLSPVSNLTLVPSSSHEAHHPSSRPLIFHSPPPYASISSPSHTCRPHSYEHEYTPSSFVLSTRHDQTTRPSPVPPCARL